MNIWNHWRGWAGIPERLGPKGGWTWSSCTSGVWWGALQDAMNIWSIPRGGAGSVHLDFQECWECSTNILSTKAPTAERR